MATLYAFLTPKWYESSLVVVPRETQSTMALAAGALAGAADLANSLTGTGGDIDHIAAVFQSRSVSDSVIDRFKLMQRYDDKFIEDTRDELWRHCDVTAGKKGNTVTVTCEDKDPAVAQDMAKYFGEVANRSLVQVSSSSARSERTFLEGRLLGARADADVANRKVRAFREDHKLVDVSEQTRAVVAAMARLRGEQMSKEMQLSYVQSFASRDASNAQQLRQQIRIIGDKQQELEQDRSVTVSSGDAPTDILPGIMTLPKLRYELEDVIRDQQITQAIFMFVTQQLEMAKANEARDTPTFQVLDAPVAATKKARPRRLLVIAIGFMLSLTLGIGWVMVPVWWEEMQLPRAGRLSPETTPQR